MMTTSRFRWVHDGPGGERQDQDHKAKAAEGVAFPRCRSCGHRIRKENIKPRGN